VLSYTYRSRARLLRINPADCLWTTEPSSAALQIDARDASCVSDQQACTLPGKRRNGTRSGIGTVRTGCRSTSSATMRRPARVKAANPAYPQVQWRIPCDGLYRRTGMKYKHMNGARAGQIQSIVVRVGGNRRH